MAGEKEVEKSVEAPVTMTVPGGADLEYLKTLSHDLGGDHNKEIEELQKTVGKTPAPTKKENKPVTEVDKDEEEEEGNSEENVDKTDKSGDKKSDKSVKKDEKSDEEDDEEEEEDAPVIDEEHDVLGLNQAKKQKEIAIKFDEETAKAIEKKFGTKDIVKSAEKWRGDSIQLKEVAKELDDIKSGLAAAPQKLAEAFNMWANGGDWENVLSKDRIDFNKPFEDQDKKLVVSFFHKELYEKKQKKLQDEAITPDDFNEWVDEMHSSAKLPYNQQKQAYDKQRADFSKKAEDDRKAFKDSAISSVDKLKEEFPNFKPNELQAIKDALVTGNINSLFFGKDGRYTDNAAKTLAFAKYGERMFKAMFSRKKTEGSNEALEAVISRADKKVKTTKTQGIADKKQQEQGIAHLQFAFKEKNPFA